MKKKEDYLIELLKETLECVEATIGLELEYNDFSRVEKFKVLKIKSRLKLQIASSVS